MALRDTINSDLKASMLAVDKIRTETLRSIRAAIIEFDKSGSDKEMTSDDEMRILLSAAKKRREAIEMYEQNNRSELAEKEKEELEVISGYLPKQMSDDEIRSKVLEVIAAQSASGPEDARKVIPILMKDLKGKADGRRIQEIVKEELSKG